jgi:hypothetical protein
LAAEIRQEVAEIAAKTIAIVDHESKTARDSSAIVQTKGRACALNKNGSFIESLLYSVVGIHRTNALPG